MAPSVWYVAAALLVVGGEVVLDDLDTAAEEDPGLLNPDLLCPSDDSAPPLVDSSRRPYGSYAADCLDDDGGVLLLDLYVSLANDVSWLFFDGFSATVLVTETDDVEEEEEEVGVGSAPI